MNYTAEEGEAAFLRTEIDFVVRDCIGRSGSSARCSSTTTCRKRFETRIHRKETTRTGRDIPGAVRQHGAVLRHLNRAFRRGFPLWLAPSRCGCSDQREVHGLRRKVEAELEGRGFRVTGDYRPEKIGARFREAQLEKVPYMLVVGERRSPPGRWPSATAWTAIWERCRWRSWLPVWRRSCAPRRSARRHGDRGPNRGGAKYGE